MDSHEHSEHRHEHKPSAPKKKNDIHKFLQWTAVIQILLLAFIALQVNNLGSVAAPSLPTPSVADAPTPSAAAAPVDMKALLDDDTVKGDANAPVTIVEWSDYECPFCARFYSETFKQIDEKYIKTGKVKFAYRDFPLSFHQQAQKAAEAAECAGEQGKYFEMHDLLFEKGVVGGVATFKGYAKDIGLDTADFNTCLDSGEMASEVQKDFLDGQKVGIQGTPGFFVNGVEVSGAQPFSVFEQVIEAALNG